MSENSTKSNYYFFKIAKAGDGGNEMDFATMMKAVLGSDDADVASRLKELHANAEKLEGLRQITLKYPGDEQEKSEGMLTDAEKIKVIEKNRAVTQYTKEVDKRDELSLNYRPKISEDAPEWMKTLAKYSGDLPEDQELTTEIEAELKQAHYYQEIFDVLSEQSEETLAVLEKNPEVWSDLMASYGLQSQGDNQEPNCGVNFSPVEAERKYKDGKLQVLDVEGTGLNLCIENGSVGVLATENKQLDQKQFDALVRYLMSTHTEITDFGQLKDLKTEYNTTNVPVNGEWEAKDSVYSVPLDFALADYLRQDEYLEKNYKDYYYRNNQEDEVPNSDSGGGDGSSDSETLDSIFGEIPDNGKTVFSYLKNKSILSNTHNNRKAAREAGREKLDENLGQMVISDSVDWGGHTVRIWATEDDKAKDGEINSKKGLKAHTKQALYRISNSRPPEASIYLGKIGPNDYSKITIPILKEFAALGYTSFIMPKANVLTKPLFKAYLEASINTGVVPCLKSKEHPDGMDMSYGDISDLMKLWKEKAEGKDLDKKIEFALRFAQQIEGFTGKDSSKVATFGAQLKMQAIFMKFNQSSLDSLRDHMAKKVDDGAWGDVDGIAAKAALTRIVDELQHGTLNGKPYNPLINNTEEIIRVFDEYQQNPELQNRIVAEINAQKASSQRDNQADPRRNQVSAVEQQYSDRFKKLTEGLKGYGVEISDVCPRITKADRGGYQRRSVPSR